MGIMLDEAAADPHQIIADLRRERDEALAREAALAEVLRVINASPSDLKSVFDTMLDKAMRLCEAAFGILLTYDGTRFHHAAERGVPPAYSAYMAQHPLVFRPGTGPARILAGERVVQILDATGNDAYRSGDPDRHTIADLAGARTILLVPLLKDDAVLGIFTVYRQEVRPFTAKQIALLQNFAAQAVIAMENTRLLTELRESLEQQQAITEVLQVINRSPGDLQPVFETILEKAHTLCGAAHGTLNLYDGENLHAVATHGVSNEFAKVLRQGYRAADSPVHRALIEAKRFVEIADCAEIDHPVFRSAVELSGIRTVLFVPLRREDAFLGHISAARLEVRPFTDKQIALLQNFAAQAVIAIENARLLGELRARTDDLTRREAELRVTFDNMGDGVAMFDADLRLAAWNRNFQQILDLPDAFLAGRPRFAEYFHYLAERGEYISADLEAELRHSIEDTGVELRFERTRPDGRVVEVRRNPVPGGGFVLIYSDITERKRAETEIHAARDAAEGALRGLQTAQASLVHAQKMAALGQLTAGVAHEIKNPLNFVNNFAGLSVELLDELKATAAPGIATLDDDTRAEVDDTIAMLTGNLDKIAEHGRRADGIVESMLLHSRGGSGDWQSVDLNTLVDEALNLAYHGARAQDQNFNITLERDLDYGLRRSR
jgi:two-component system NtrC family sensor kinase